MALEFPLKKGPEYYIQQAIIKKLTLLQWFVMETHGNMYQRGFPDLYATHKRYGHRWIEVKNSKSYQFTPAQLETFPKLVSHGAGVWVLVGDSDSEIAKLFQVCNWVFYL